MMSAENTAKIAGGRYMQKHYTEIVDPQKEETRTADEIVQHMKEKVSRIGGEGK